MSEAATEPVHDEHGKGGLTKDDAAVCVGDGTTCSECGKVFSHPFYFSTHISAHIVEKDFPVVGQCALCGLTFSDPTIFATHLTSSQARMESQMAPDSNDGDNPSGVVGLDDTDVGNVDPSLSGNLSEVSNHSSGESNRRKRQNSEAAEQVASSNASVPKHRRKRKPPQKYDPTADSYTPASTVDSDPEVEAYLQSLSEMGLTVDPAAFSSPRGMKRGRLPARTSRSAGRGRGRMKKSVIMSPDAVIDPPKKPSPKYEYLDYDILLEDDLEVLPKSGKLTRAERLQQRQERLSQTEGGSEDVRKLRTFKLEDDEDEKKSRRRRGSAGRSSSMVEESQKAVISPTGSMNIGQPTFRGVNPQPYFQMRPKQQSASPSLVPRIVPLTRVPIGGFKYQGQFRGNVGYQQQRGRGGMLPNTFNQRPNVTAKTSSSLADIKRDSREYVEKMLQSAGVLAVSSNMANKANVPGLKNGASGCQPQRNTLGIPYPTSAHQNSHYRGGARLCYKPAGCERPVTGWLGNRNPNGRGCIRPPYPSGFHTCQKSRGIPANTCKRHFPGANVGGVINGRGLTRGHSVGPVRCCKHQRPLPTPQKSNLVTGDVIVIDDDDDLEIGKMEKVDRSSCAMKEGLVCDSKADSLPRNISSKIRKSGGEKCSVSIRDIDKDGQSSDMECISDQTKASSENTELSSHNKEKDESNRQRKQRRAEENDDNKDENDTEEEEVEEILQEGEDIEGWKVCLAENSDSDDEENDGNENDDDTGPPAHEENEHTLSPHSPRQDDSAVFHQEVDNSSPVEKQGRDQFSEDNPMSRSPQEDDVKQSVKPETGRLSKNQPETDRLSENHPETDRLSENHPETGTLSGNQPEAARLSENHSETGNLSENHPEKSSLSENHSEIGNLSENHPETGRLSDSQPLQPCSPKPVSSENQPEKKRMSSVSTPTQNSLVQDSSTPIDNCMARDLQENIPNLPQHDSHSPETKPISSLTIVEKYDNSTLKASQKDTLLAGSVPSTAIPDQNNAELCRDTSDVNDPLLEDRSNEKPSDKKTYPTVQSIPSDKDHVPFVSHSDDSTTDYGYSSSQSESKLSPVSSTSSEKLSVTFESSADSKQTLDLVSNSSKTVNELFCISQNPLPSSAEGKNSNTIHHVKESSNLMDIFSEIEKTCKEIEGNSENDTSDSAAVENSVVKNHVPSSNSSVQDSSSHFISCTPDEMQENIGKPLQSLPLDVETKAVDESSKHVDVDIQILGASKDEADFQEVLKNLDFQNSQENKNELMQCDRQKDSVLMTETENWEREEGRRVITSEGENEEISITKELCEAQHGSSDAKFKTYTVIKKKEIGDVPQALAEKEIAISEACRDRDEPMQKVFEDGVGLSTTDNESGSLETSGNFEAEKMEIHTEDELGQEQDQPIQKVAEDALDLGTTNSKL